MRTDFISLDSMDIDRSLLSHSPDAHTPERGLSVYVHVPFCAQKCAYCDFYSLPNSGQKAEQSSAFVQGIFTELRQYLNHMQQLDSATKWQLKTLYFGGGTPTSLPTEDLLGLVQGILQEFSSRFGPLKPAPIPEITVEMNPESTRMQQLRDLYCLGVNRLSIGVQSMHPRLLRLLGRKHTPKEVVQAVEASRAAGFQNLSLDLMYGLPEQNLQIWQDSLRQTLAFKPEHLALYPLKIEAGTPFDQRYTAGEWPLPSEEEEVEMFEWAGETLHTAGYQHYEIANFSLPGYAAVHNQGYWQHQEYLGLGPSAHSCLRGIYPDQVWPNSRQNLGQNVKIPKADTALVRFANQKNLDLYLQLLNQRQSPVASWEGIPSDQEQEETMFLGLRCLAGVSQRQFQQRFGLSIEEAFPGVLKKLAQKGLIIYDEQQVALHPKALLVGNQVFLEFIR